jgi:hypothetical protein
MIPDVPDVPQMLHEAMYRAELSALYHRKRERFLALCDRLGKAFSLIAGTAAFSSLLASAESKSYAGLGVAIATLPGLVFSWADKARLHSELAQKYIAIQAEIVGVQSAEVTEALTCEWHARLRQIESNEPPTLTCLVRICQNQLALAAGQPEGVEQIRWWQYAFAHIFDMQAERIHTVASKIP